MSSAGHIQDMLNRMRQNANRKISSREKFKSKGTVTNAPVVEETTYDFPEVSARRLNKIKTEIQLEAQRRLKRHLFIFSIVFVFIVTLFLLIQLS